MAVFLRLVALACLVDARQVDQIVLVVRELREQRCGRPLDPTADISVHIIAASEHPHGLDGYERPKGPAVTVEADHRFIAIGDL